ncbi:MAG TPA: hypothetical protein VJC20_04325 [Candidatus Paceibacterota bacterium]
MKAGVTILLCVAGFLFLGWIGRPLWDNIVLLRAEINRVNSALSELEQSKQVQQDLIAAYNTISDRELDLLLNQHLPAKTDTGTLLIALEDVARRHNAVINTISFKEAVSMQPQTTAQRQRAALATVSEQQPMVEKLAFTLSLSVSYEDFKAFLESLESHVRLIDVESISFSGGTARGVYTVSLAAKTYYRK